LWIDLWHLHLLLETAHCNQKGFGDTEPFQNYFVSPTAGTRRAYALLYAQDLAA